MQAERRPNNSVRPPHRLVRARSVCLSTSSAGAAVVLLLLLLLAATLGQMSSLQPPGRGRRSAFDFVAGARLRRPD